MIPPFVLAVLCLVPFVPILYRDYKHTSSLLSRL
nr:MAG TPA: hypothetical protein [Caudoviricetes sp.]